MKTLTRFIPLILGFLFLCKSSFGSERDTLSIDSIYVNHSEYLIEERIIEIDSASTSELMKRFENWAGTTFKNYEKVRTSKTDNQITLDYIVSTGLVMDWYVRLVVEFKDGKVRLRFYDEGNTAYFGNPNISARSYHFTSYFNSDKVIIYKTKPGAFNAKEKQASAAIRFKLNARLTANSIEEALKTTSKTNDSDW